MSDLKFNKFEGFEEEMEYQYSRLKQNLYKINFPITPLNKSGILAEGFFNTNRIRIMFFVMDANEYPNPFVNLVLSLDHQFGNEFFSFNFYKFENYANYQTVSNIDSIEDNLIKISKKIDQLKFSLKEDSYNDMSQKILNLLKEV